MNSINYKTIDEYLGDLPIDEKQSLFNFTFLKSSAVIPSSEVIKGLKIIPVKSLEQLVIHLKGEELIPEKLIGTSASEFMTRNPVMLHQGTTVREALKTFENTKLRVLPVVDDSGHVDGFINLEDIGYVDVRRQEISLSETVMHTRISRGLPSALWFTVMVP